MDKLRIGIIGKMDNSGLGSLNFEFSQHIRPTKILLTQNKVFQVFPERYKEFNTRIVRGGYQLSKEDMEWITDEVDMILAFETFFNWDVVSMARKKGVKTALITMCEMQPIKLPHNPDLFICPSRLDFNLMPDPKIFIPVPVNTDKLKWRERKQAKVFIHAASHGGMYGRKGTHLLIQAMKFIKSPIKLIIYSWQPFEVDDPRVEVRVQNFKNYWQIWEQGDVLVYPQDYNGICLPVVEAMSSGMLVISTDIFPFNEYLPLDPLFKPIGYQKIRIGVNTYEMDGAIISIESIARKIDEFYDQDITSYSGYGRKWAMENNWETLLPKYIKIFKKLCGV